MHDIHIDESVIVLRAGERETVVSHVALCTRFGLLIGSPHDLDEEAWAGGQHVTGRLDMAQAGPWVDRPPQETAAALAMRPATLPRAVLWSALLRSAVDAHRLDASAAFDLQASPTLGDEGAADALRACALAGLMVGSHDTSTEAMHGDVVQWQRRRPWTDVTLGATGETLIARGGRLPASTRLLRRYVSYGQAAGGPTETLALVLGEETLAVELPDAAEYLGQQEFELRWAQDGTLALDLLIDSLWRPLPAPLVLSPSEGSIHHAALQVYRQMSAWSEVASRLQVRLLETVEA